MSSSISIETTQNVTLEYEVASVGERILAALLDLLAYLSWIFIFYLITLSIGRSPGSVVTFLYFLPISFYSLICELALNGQSLGKIVMQIRVVKKDGLPPTIGSYLMRWLMRIVDIWITSPAIGAVATIAIIANGKGQRIGDIAAGTCVIRLKKRLNLKDTMFKEQNLDYIVNFPEVVNLSDKDINIIKNVYRQAIKKKQYEIIDELARKVQTTLNVYALMSSDEFIKTVVKDYYHLMSGM